MLRRSLIAVAARAAAASPAAARAPLKSALIHSWTGPLEAYARQTARNPMQNALALVDEAIFSPIRPGAPEADVVVSRDRAIRRSRG